MKKITKVTRDTQLEAGFYFEVSLKSSTDEQKYRARIYCDESYENSSSSKVFVFSNFGPFGRMPEYGFGEYTSFVADSLTEVGTYRLQGIRFSGGAITVGEFLDHFNNSISIVKAVFTEHLVEWEPFVGVSLIHPNYRLDHLYSGFHGYHHSHSTSWNAPLFSGSKPYKIGVELEVEAKSAEDKSRITRFKSNWFQMERDGSLNENGIEFVTIPLVAEDAVNMTTWSPLLDEIRQNVNSWTSTRCGLHVHIGREIFDSRYSLHIGKLLYLYHHLLKDEPYNSFVFGRSKGYNAPDGKTGAGNIAKIVGSSALRKKGVQDALSDSMVSRSIEERYFDINILTTDTIEFRLGRSTTKPERLVSVVSYCEMMCLYAKETSWDKLSSKGFIKYIKSHVANDSPLLNYIKNGQE